jgi:hypothetical protein
MRKLSAILIELAEEVLAQPVDKTSGGGLHAALLLAQVAWNRAIDYDERDTKGNWPDLIAQFERDDPKTRAGLKSYDCEELIEEIYQLKLDRHPSDDRFVHVCGTTPEGNVHVEWTHGRVKREK